MNWSPARGQVRFCDIFSSYQAFFPLGPFTHSGGGEGKEGFHFFHRPDGRQPTLLFVLVARTAHPAPYRGEFLFSGTPSGSPAAILRSRYSPDQAAVRSMRSDPSRQAGTFSAVFVSRDSLNNSPVRSIARMTVKSLRAVATTATFLRFAWLPAIRS